jgi:large subunit ribosomal protein L25
MSEDIRLFAQKRSVIGKKVKTLRREGKLPAVMYGKNFDPVPIVLDLAETTLALRGTSQATLFQIEVDGEDSPAFIRDAQYDRIKRELIHIDFLKVSMTETLTAMVPVNLVGEAPVTSDGAIIMTDSETIEIEALPSDIPESIDVDLTRLVEVGDSISAGELDFGDKVTLISDPDMTIVVAVYGTQEEPEEEEVEEEFEGAEPEVIERGKREDEEEEA